jgi:hypothetical protein
MKKINEKTFELNITNQLLDISRSYVHLMTKPFLGSLMTEEEWFKMLTDNIFFAEGLTQAQEADPLTGGYDVSINYPTQTGTARLLFLQYKAGRRASYCTNSSSQFHGSKKNKKPHIVFTFNDAADYTQHSILRNLASQKKIKPDSVLYVFPRITEKAEFIKHFNDLLEHCSFVPVLEIDRQGAAQKPPIQILDSKVHRYRTSYDGNTSEVNYYYYAYYYDQTIFADFMAELICVQFERFFTNLKYIKRPYTPDVAYFMQNLKEKINSHEGRIFNGLNIAADKISSYLDSFVFNGLSWPDFVIAKAPQKYSTEIPKDGIVFQTEKKANLENVNYQIF